ncbi:uncharacterized protein QYS62_008373 [Fusarium acuminatum]|uniref:Uncharacterized protein n=1 Tax=Fusarium acuminatum TaxID=5515 RepID=A0ABZ2X2P7_9HYPO
MTDYIEGMIQNVYSPDYEAKRYPGGRKNPDNHHHYRKWGFTVYRTHYAKESEEAWERLLHSLRHQTRLAFGVFEQEDVDKDDVQRLKDLFRIDVREDPSQLGGLDAQGIRDFCNAESLKEQQAVVQRPGKRHRLTTRPNESRGMADFVHQFVLMADEATLRDVASGEFIVKAVPLEWREGDGCPGGWMRIPTGYLLDLWIALCDWSCRTEIALRFHGSEKELHSWIWPGDDNSPGTGEYSEIRRFPHYNNQQSFERLYP